MLKYDYAYKERDSEGFVDFRDTLEPTGYRSPVMGDVKQKSKGSDVDVEKTTGLKGTVKFFNDERGWGIIDGADGKNYFVHFSDIVKVGAEYRTLLDGQTVTFSPEQDERGPKAVNVR